MECIFGTVFKQLFLNRLNLLISESFLFATTSLYCYRPEALILRADSSIFKPNETQKSKL